MKSSRMNTTSVENFNSGIESSVPKKKKRKNSQSSLTEEFKKAKFLPSMEKLRKEKKLRHGCLV
jgi:hypothetical protein